MKPQVQNYGFILPNERSWDRFNNSKKNTSEMYDIAQNYRIIQSGSAFVSS
jgi:hypothetical protein